MTSLGLLSFLESQELDLKDLPSLNDSGILDNPLLGPPVAKDAISWHTSGGLLFQEL